MRRLALSVGLVICLAVVSAVAADEAGNQRAAERDAADSLSLLRLPAGAERVDANPAADPALLDEPGIGRSASPNQIVQLEFWRVPGEPPQVFQWLIEHSPAGTRIGATSRGGRYGAPAVWSVAFVRPPILNVVDPRQLAVTVAAAAGGGTAVRADGMATWLIPRPASERVPGGAQLLQVTIRGRERAPVIRFAVRDSRRIALAARVLNRLPVVQPGVVVCALDRGINADMSFQRGDGSVLARAVANTGGCGAVRITTRGKAQPDLNGYGLVADLEAALGQPIDLSRFAPSDEPAVPVARVAHGRTFGGVPFEAVAYDAGPRVGLCVQLFEAGVQRGMGCLVNPRGKQRSTFAAPTCYPRALTGAGALGPGAATKAIRFDDGARIRPTAYHLSDQTVTTNIGLKANRIVRLKRPMKVSLGYRGPFAFAFRRGVHDLDTRYGPFSHC